MTIKKRAAKKVPISYANGKIYKIVNSLNLLLYIGSTCSTLSRRFSGHKNHAKREDSHFYRAMNELGVENFKIILVEAYPCKNKSELEAREYAVTNTYARDTLYNMKFDGHHAKETKKRMSEVHIGKCVGIDHPNFTRGTIMQCSDNGNLRWRFQWHENGQKQSKSYSFPAKRTSQAAHMLCMAMRDEIFPLENRDFLMELPFSNDQ